MIDTREITIIIPHLGADEQQERSLDLCLESLAETAPHIEVLVAKNGPNCKHKGEITIADQGQCKAVNKAVFETSTKWIFISNDDMIYPPLWFEKLKRVEELKSTPEWYPYCVSPILVEPRQGAPTFETYFAGGAGGDFDLKKFIFYASSRSSMGLRPGFNLPFLMLRELWNTIGGYDEAYDPWGSNSDSDLAYKVRLAGIQPYQQTDCCVYHFSQTSGTFHPDNRSYWNKNFEYFTQKWGFPRTDTYIWEATFKMPIGSLDGGERIFEPTWEGAYGPIN
jgi:GT2 family glycosyltransferase